MERESANRKYDALHKTRTWHDGTFPDDPEAWTAERTPDTPFHYRDGVTIYAAPIDVNPHDHFLGGAGACEECSGSGPDAGALSWPDHDGPSGQAGADEQERHG